jgi:hypothetical protein
VPNVVYSCGALVHAGPLVLPCGIGDAAIGIATPPLPELLATRRLRPETLRSTTLYANNVDRASSRVFTRRPSPENGVMHIALGESRCSALSEPLWG